MLTLFNVIRKDHKTPDRDAVVLNTEFISQVRVYDTSHSRFRFFYRPESKRGGRDKYIVEQTNAEIVTAMNSAFAAVGITLNVYPDHNPLATPVATIFNVAEIIIAYQYEYNPLFTWIECNEKGWKQRLYLVDILLKDLPGKSETGTTTTTSTSTTSTSTTSTTTTTTTGEDQGQQQL